LRRAWVVSSPNTAGFAAGCRILTPLIVPADPAAFLLQSWQFMRRRIDVEDRLLLKFFGAEWEEWRQAVPSGLPWIP